MYGKKTGELFKKWMAGAVSLSIVLSCAGMNAFAEAATEASSEAVAEGAESTTEGTAVNPDAVRVVSLKGPTTIGLVNLMEEDKNGTSAQDYEFTMAPSPDEIPAAFTRGDYDIAMLPSNMAAVLYNKMQGGVSVIDLNTLGVLYIVTGSDDVSTIDDLSGKKLMLTGQGATPEYAIEYLLDKSGVTDCELEFYSDPTEIAARLADDPTGVALLPQPFVTAAEMQNDSLKTVISLSDEWDQTSDNGSRLITGVTIVQNSFLEKHPDKVETFLEEHAKSAEAAVSDVDTTAKLVVEQGIIARKPIAQKAIPECNIVCITGDEMKTALSGYLQTLYDADPKSVGGTLPGDDLYYTGE